jgi:hypothetical protein
MLYAGPQQLLFAVSGIAQQAQEWNPAESRMGGAFHAIHSEAGTASQPMRQGAQQAAVKQLAIELSVNCRGGQLFNHSVDSIDAIHKAAHLQHQLLPLLALLPRPPPLQRQPINQLAQRTPAHLVYKPLQHTPTQSLLSYTDGPETLLFTLAAIHRLTYFLHQLLPLPAYVYKLHSGTGQQSTTSTRCHVHQRTFCISLCLFQLCVIVLLLLLAILHVAFRALLARHLPRQANAIPLQQQHLK